MLAYARLVPGKGFKPRSALLYYVQRAVTVPSARRTLSRAIAAGVRARHGDGAGWAEGEAHARVMADLRRDGLAMLLPTADSTISDMVGYFSEQPVQGPGGQEVRLDQLDGVAAAAYSLDRVLECPGLLDLLNAPAMLRIASDYLGCSPTLSSVGVRWSFPTGGPITRTQNYHRDIDDWRFLKLFIYLTDVDEGAGPHCYVRTSHKSAFGWKAKAYSQGELERRFGADRMATVVGPRGTTFVADTIGVHRGLAPARGARLILQAQYSLLPVYAFVYSGARTGREVGAAYCNRLLVG